MKARYTPYLTAAVAQAKAAGVRLAMGGVETVDPAKCEPVGHVQITEMYRPLNKPVCAAPLRRRVGEKWEMTKGKWPLSAVRRGLFYGGKGVRCTRFRVPHPAVSPACGVSTPAATRANRAMPSRMR